jgi:hypothetical protein
VTCVTSAHIMNAVNIARDRQEGCCDTVRRRSAVTKKMYRRIEKYAEKEDLSFSVAAPGTICPGNASHVWHRARPCRLSRELRLSGSFLKKEVSSCIWGRQNEANITKLYSLRNVPVHLLDQVGSYTHR